MGIRARSLVLRFVLPAGLLATAAGGARVAAARWWPLALQGDPGAALPGLRIDGQAMGSGPVRGLVQARADALAARRVRLVVLEGGTVRPVLEASLGDLGVTVDVDNVTAQALRVGRTGDRLTQAKTADAARRGAIDLPLQPHVEARAVLPRLVALKDDLDTAAVPARLDLEKRAIVPEVLGRALDVDAALDRLERAALSPATVEIELPFAEVAPAVTRASLAKVDVSQVLASYQTFFSRYGDQGPRARNIEVAAAHVDGLVVQPSQTVSFNDVVGDRTEDNGFRRAFEIVKGEFKEGTGGGTCQVASTLHAVAFFGGLDILQRLPHSRPSGYIPAGLDATVVYPVVDLKIRNPFTFPVVVHATVGANVIKMELLGADKPVEVSFGKSVLSTTPYGRRVEEDPTVARPKRKQKGIDGMELFRTRALAYRDGTRRTEGSRDVYPPTSEIWLVPPGYDASSLPALGEDLPKPDPKPEAADAHALAAPPG